MRVARVRASWAALPVRERRTLVAAVLLGLAIRAIYVAATAGHALAGDEIEYDIEGRFIAAGKWFWTTTPYGVPHASMWKAPGYPAWVGSIYAVVGRHPDVVLALQCLVGALTIALTWRFARRLAGPRVAMAAAVVVAVYPGVWQYETRLYSEALALPLTVLLLDAVIDRTPTWRRAAGVGLLAGVLLLLRPSSSLLLAGVAVAWVLACGLRTGAVRLALTLAVAAAVVAPWTLRNHHVAGAWVPISMQDAAAYGVFNDDAAHDREFRWAWRPLPARDRDLFDPRHPRSDPDLRRALQHRTQTYISDHPASLPKAFVYNGIIRLWDLRRPGYALVEVPFEGRTRSVARIALYSYWLLLLAAVIGLVSLRRRPRIWLPLAAVALAASIVFTSDGGTRYRSPLEPVIVILACIGGLALAERARRRAGPLSAP